MAIESEKKNKSHRKRNVILVLVSIYLIIFAVLYIIIFVLPKVDEAFHAETATIKEGTLKLSSAGRALIVRTETLYASSVTGKVSESPSEGRKVKKGESLFYVRAGGEGASKGAFAKLLTNATKLEKTNGSVAQKTSIVSYASDGYEKKFTLGKIKKITEKDIAFDYDVMSLKRENIFTGEPFYKLVDNNKWWLVYRARNDDGLVDKYKKGAEVNVKIDYKYITGIIRNVYKSGGNNMVVIQFDKYYKNLAKKRTVKIEVIFEEGKGLMIRTDYIIRRNGTLGVLKRFQGGATRFVPVNIVAQDSDNAIVSSGRYLDGDGTERETVNYYDEIVVDPSNFSESET
jgi:hypothetical protein